MPSTQGHVSSRAPLLRWQTKDPPFGIFREGFLEVVIFISVLKRQGQFPYQHDQDHYFLICFPI